jgi:predicted DNA-binding transcriptional regulator AlpA
LSIHGYVKTTAFEANHSGLVTDEVMQSNPTMVAAAANRKPLPHAVGIPAQYLLEAGGLLRLPQVLALYPVSRSTWWQMVRDGRAPQPLKLAPRCTAWHSADIANLIESTRKAGAQ